MPLNEEAFNVPTRFIVQYRYGRVEGIQIDTVPILMPLIVFKRHYSSLLLPDRCLSYVSRV
jgi:uncharacterized membrane protein